MRSKGRLSIFCFRYVPPGLAGNEEALDTLNKKVMEHMQAGGVAFVTSATLAGRFVLRASVLHHGTIEEDIHAMLQTVEDTGRQVMRRM